VKERNIVLSSRPKGVALQNVLIEGRILVVFGFAELLPKSAEQLLIHKIPHDKTDVIKNALNKSQYFESLHKCILAWQCMGLKLLEFMSS
jgi:hypothetical protein